MKVKAGQGCPPPTPPQSKQERGLYTQTYLPSFSSSLDKGVRIGWIDSLTIKIQEKKWLHWRLTRPGAESHDLHIAAAPGGVREEWREETSVVGELEVGVEGVGVAESVGASGVSTNTGAYRSEKGGVWIEILATCKHATRAQPLTCCRHARDIALFHGGH